MPTARKGNMYFFIITLLMIIGSVVVGFLPIETKYNTAVIEFGFLLVPALIIAKLSGITIKETFEIKWLKFKDVCIILGISVLSLLLAGIMSNISMQFFNNFLADAMNVWGNMSLLQWIFILAITPAICEEAVMRGVVLKQYKNVSCTKAAIMNGLLFGMFHMNFNQFFYAFVLGVVMAYLVIITGTILSSVLMHFTINGISAVSNWYIRRTSPVIDVAENSSLNITNIIILAGVGILIAYLLKHIISSWAKTKNIDILTRTNTDEKVFDIWVVLSIGLFVIFTIILFMQGGKI
ncbi:type II CAAX endopeptidase family protein [Oceanirhabdus sp. W0125-5]|uniref:type II CAAX endopeptidase family protein n=1 Tax=Oceanirhabdus sp. W0125-5 TaxID=2999116 RepID=UPI0022F305FE|nr:type II CAAX endopeptidase family protein [Oceanirhabdus sp. W0125-5]WBW97514.1 type II CAAX endopeptidase family protein [Oceanirhabdus sp. W0125-5]